MAQQESCVGQMFKKVRLEGLAYRVDLTPRCENCPRGRKPTKPSPTYINSSNPDLMEINNQAEGFRVSAQGYMRAECDQANS